ncbi:rhomboid family intramembrane serine protease [Maritimibacter alkaliphilus]|uniref:rhomboid family intramembrane serine protease n=1 Tax=Maritimibacter alkaliphilus TaxID=404236 RepID=UPI0028F723DC|nr:rhomboid family intramembrane serine protease [Maritimibacter alkaliphilus]
MPPIIVKALSALAEEEPMYQSGQESPINPLPTVVLLLFAGIMAMEVVLSLGSWGVVGGPQAIGWRLTAIQRFSFSGEIFDWMVENRRFPPEHMLRFVTYPFVHPAFTSALFSGVMLLALGKWVGEVIHGLAMLVVFFASAIVGALAYGFFTEDPMPLMGAFPPVYGLIGVFTHLMWIRLGQIGQKQARAFTLIGMLMALQLLFGLLFGAHSDWVADLAGFVTGFVLTPLLVPGGFAALLARLRRE